MNTIKDVNRMKFMKQYQSIDVPSFIEGKTLYVEQVKPNSKVRGWDCIKIDVRIMADEKEIQTSQGEHYKGLNTDKVFTLRIDKREDEDEYDFYNRKQHYQDLQNRIVTIEDDYITDAYIYNLNHLTIGITKLDYSSDVVESEDEKISNQSRQINHLNLFITFDVERFLEENNIMILCCHAYQGQKVARLNAMVVDYESKKVKGYFFIDVYVKNFDELPSKVLQLRGDFSKLVEDYQYRYTVSAKNDTYWKMIFESITFKPNTILPEESYTLTITDK